MGGWKNNCKEGYGIYYFSNKDKYKREYEEVFNNVFVCISCNDEFDKLYWLYYS